MLSQYILVINTTSKNNQVWARLTDERVARDDRGRHIECGVYLTNHSREVRFEGPKPEKIMINKCIDYSHVIREQVWFGND